MSRASRATVEARKAAMVLLFKRGITQARDIRRVTRHDAETNEASPWRTGDGRPLHRDTLWRYAKSATARLKGVKDKDLDRVIARHIAARLELYDLALAADDLARAQAVLDSLARIEGVTPEGMLAAALDRAREERAAVALPAALAARQNGVANGVGAHPGGANGVGGDPGRNGGSNGANGAGQH